MVDELGANAGGTDRTLEPSLLVEAGAAVTADTALLIMEAMKMEHTIRAPADGKVVEFYYQAGDLVDGGAELLNFELTE